MNCIPNFPKPAGFIPALLAFFFFTQTLFAQNYQNVWDALVRNDRPAARELLQKALDNPATATDALSTLFFLETFEGREEDFNKAFENHYKDLKNPDPYYMLFWGAESLVGDYGYKTPEQVRFLKKLIDGAEAEPCLKMRAAMYLSGHYLSQQEKKKADEYAAAVSNIHAWQVVGPFDNLIECGFDKNYPPIDQPKADAVFASKYNAEIQWRKAGAVSVSGWVYLSSMTSWSNGIMYAQSFVTVQEDMDAVVSLASFGSLKVWVNDRLILSDPEMRHTEDPVFQAPCRLKKGVNRILVQNGFLNQSLYGFRLNLCDAKGNLLPNLKVSDSFSPYSKDGEKKLPERIPYFAETFFKEKLAGDPENLTNYLLLARYYNSVSDYTLGLETISKAIEKAPDCAMLRYFRLFSLNGLQNSTASDGESKTIISLDPESVYALEVKFNQEVATENLDEAEKISLRYVDLYGENRTTYAQKLTLANKREKYQEAVDILDEGYKKFRNVWEYSKAQYEIESKIRNNQKAAFEVYESFLKKNYKVAAAATLAASYMSKDRADDGIEIYENLAMLYPMNTDFPTELFGFYFNKKDKKNAAPWLARLLEISPDSEKHLTWAAKLAELENDNTRALELYKKALTHAPNNFDTRERIRELQKKPSLKKHFPETDPYELLKNVSLEGKEGKYNWFYVFDEANVVLYPEQNSEGIYTHVVKVLDEDGVDVWKEHTIPFDDNMQRLIIEKAEIVKPSGAKIAAERNENVLIFTNLQPGDGIYIRFRIQNYFSHRISREFVDSHGFNWFVPMDHTRYNLLAPKSQPVNYRLLNGASEPQIQEIPADGYVMYIWETKNVAILENEPLSPSAGDLQQKVVVGTMKDWSLISDWYGDISARQARGDYEVKKLIAELFPQGETTDEMTKARRIYEWILKNIQYSSVSFRQSGLVPQRASRVIQTRLGDCKDLATLYAALAREVGLKANLVLLSSRDYGEVGLALPAMNFDHCIVKVVADGTVWYLELTISGLPFGSLPMGDFQSFVLEIPFDEDKPTRQGLFALDPPNRTPDNSITQVDIRVGKKDLDFQVKAVASGANTVWLRSNYRTLPSAKRLEEFQKNIAKDFNNPVSVKQVGFGNLEVLSDTLGHNIQFTVKNEVLEIGDLSTFKIPFYFNFVQAGSFPEDELRKYPVAYRAYEGCDNYHDKITVNLVPGKTFQVVPANVELQYDNIRYSLTFTRTAPDVLTIERKIKTRRVDIPAADYSKFRDFVLSIVEAEGKMIAFK